MTSGTVIVCAHNEQAYIKDCLVSILSQTTPPEFIIVIADRCNDNTVNIAKQQLETTRSAILAKETSSWNNSISENLQLGLRYARGDAFVVVDADMIVPPRFLETLLADLDGYAAVSALVRTDPSAGRLNKIVAVWELTYRFTPFEEQPRGGARAISLRALHEVGEFHDVYAWESELDARLRRSGFRVKLDRRVSVLHRRRMTMSRSVAYQIKAGRARRQLSVSLMRTALHSLVRLRPFVLYGYLGSATKPDR